MAELFCHTDEDGDTLIVKEPPSLLSERLAVFSIDGQEACVYLDRDAALVLVDALVSFYSPKDLTETGVVDG